MSIKLLLITFPSQFLQFLKWDEYNSLEEEEWVKFELIKLNSKPKEIVITSKSYSNSSLALI